VNGTPFDLGSPLDQVQAQAPYSEAEGLTDKTAPVAKAAVKENQKFRVDQDGLNLLEEFEGREPKAYRDGTDHLHIGIGHKFTDEELNTGTVMIGGQAVDWRGGLRDAQINQLAAQDIAAAAEAVRKYVTVPLDQNKFNALVSFVFNIGSGAFKSSGALKALNSGNEQEFLRRHDLWNKAGGSTLEGLQKRRAFESALFSRGNVERR
jgi:lysozyme